MKYGLWTIPFLIFSIGAQAKSCGLLLTSAKSIEDEEPQVELVDTEIKVLGDEKVEINIIGHKSFNTEKQQEAYKLLHGTHKIDEERVSVNGAPLGVAKVAQLPNMAKMVISYDEDYKEMHVERMKKFSKNIKRRPDLKKFTSSYDVDTPEGYLYAGGQGGGSFSFAIVFCEGKGPAKKHSASVNSAIDI